MHITESETIISTKRTHIFKCDHCNADLGTSIEYDDGYYEEYGQRNILDVLRTLINTLPEPKKDIYLCNDCYEKFFEEFKKEFLELVNKYQ